MNTKSLVTRDYENWTLGQIGQTNPKQSQFPADSKMNVSAFNTMNYEQWTMNCLTKTNPTCRVEAPGEDGFKANSIAA